MDTNTSQPNLDRIADVLLEWGGNAAVILDHMASWADRVPPGAPSIHDTLQRIIRATLRRLDGRFSAGELALCASVLTDGVRLLQEEIMLVPPDVTE